MCAGNRIEKLYFQILYIHHFIKKRDTFTPHLTRYAAIDGENHTK